MKSYKIALSILLSLSIFVFSNKANARRSKSQTKGVVIKVQEFPDIDLFKTASYGYVDLGYHYTTLGIMGIPLYNYGGEFCGYIGRTDKYLILNADAIKIPVQNYNNFAKKHKLKEIRLSDILTSKDALMALQTIYNNQVRVKNKKLPVLKMKIDSPPKLSFWNRVGGKLVVGGLLFLIFGFTIFSKITKKSRKKEKSNENQTPPANE